MVKNRYEELKITQKELKIKGNKTKNKKVCNDYDVRYVVITRKSVGKPMPNLRGYKRMPNNMLPLHNFTPV
jgi:hypothetical protein